MKILFDEQDTTTSLLQSEYEERCARTKSYSLRAFARDLKCSTATLSLVLSGRRKLSGDKARKFSEYLKLETTHAEYFSNLAESESSRSHTQKLLARNQLRVLRQQRTSSIDLDAFSFISEWYHIAILELIQLPQSQHSFVWISSKLSISIQEVQAAIERMLRLKVMKEESGRWYPLAAFVSGPDGIPSKAIRSLHKQLMNKAIRTLDETPIETRDCSSLVLAFDSSQMIQAKDLIRKFRQNFSKNLPLPRNPDSVYCLGIQFHRLDLEVEF